MPPFDRNRERRTSKQLPIGRQSSSTTTTTTPTTTTTSSQTKGDYKKQNKKTTTPNSSSIARISSWVVHMIAVRHRAGGGARPEGVASGTMACKEGMLGDTRAGDHREPRRRRHGHHPFGGFENEQLATSRRGGPRLDSPGTWARREADDCVLCIDLAHRRLGQYLITGASRDQVMAAPYLPARQTHYSWPSSKFITCVIIIIFIIIIIVNKLLVHSPLL